LEEAESLTKLALLVVNRIRDEGTKIDTLKEIAIEFVRNGSFQNAESFSQEITQKEDFHNLWDNISKIFLEKEPPLEALKLAKNFKSEEAQIHYLKGWAEHLTVHQANFETVKLGMHYLRDDVQSMENLLQAYALNRLFFADASDAEIAQLNRTLNIQWAIDIKNNNSENDQ
jgi:hypothetical protein